MNTKPM